MADNKRRGANPLGAILTGAVVGAGAVIAGAVALSDKGNRKTINDAFSKAKSRMDGYLGNVQKETNKEKTKMKKVANKVINSAEKVTVKAKQEVKKI